MTLDTLFVFAGYLAVDLVLAVGGYGSLQKIIRGWPVRHARSPRSPEQICAALDRAARWYPARRLCLARSAAAACLLRWHGLPASMVVGARQMPFHAHAWIELDGRVVADSATVQERYRVLDRL
jgi:hypothetical protein